MCSLGAANVLQRLSFRIPVRVCDCIEIIQQTERPKRPRVDHKRGRRLALLGICQREPRHADALRKLLERDLAAQPRPTDVSPETRKRGLDSGWWAPGDLAEAQGSFTLHTS